MRLSTSWLALAALSVPVSIASVAVAGDLSEVDACALLTSDEIAEHLGKAPGAAEAKMFGLIPTCTWPSADGKELQILNVTVSRRSTADYESFMADQKAAWEEMFSEDDYERFDVGDFAVWQDDAIFFVIVGDFQLQIGGSLRDGLPSKEACVALGELAASRLP